MERSGLAAPADQAVWRTDVSRYYGDQIKVKALRNPGQRGRGFGAARASESSRSSLDTAAEPAEKPRVQ